MAKVTLKIRPRKDDKTASLRLEYSPPIPHPTKPNKTIRWKTIPGQFLYGKTINGEFKHNYQHLTPREKQHNKNTWETCNMMHAKFQNEFLKSEIYTDFELDKLAIKEIKELNVFDLYDKKVKHKAESNRKIYESSKMHLEKFNSGTMLRLKHINKDMLLNFKYFLLNAERLKSKGYIITDQSASLYYNKFISIIRDYEFLKTDIKEAGKIKVEETEVVFLDKNEIKLLKKQFNDQGILYRVTFFMILTGLRTSDVVRLKWSDLKKDTQGYFISITIKKTPKPIKHHINSDALKLMGEPDDNKLVFAELKEKYHRNKLIEICNAAGINKHITFHKLRHTFAVHMLEETGNLMMLKELLHHDNINSTLVYANIVETTKRQALDNFTLKSLSI